MKREKPAPSRNMPAGVVKDAGKKEPNAGPPDYTLPGYPSSKDKTK